MPSQRFLNELSRLFDNWVTDVIESELTDNSVRDYIAFVDQFVRYARGDFKPGQNVGRVGPPRKN